MRSKWKKDNNIDVQQQHYEIGFNELLYFRHHHAALAHHVHLLNESHALGLLQLHEWMLKTELVVISQVPSPIQEKFKIAQQLN